MIFDHRDPRAPKGVTLVDLGTGKRIPFARRFDTDTGEWWALLPSADGQDVMVDEHGKPIEVRGKAVGKLQLVPNDQAHQFGQKPRKVHSPIEPLSADVCRQGLEQYKEVFVKVWTEVRHEPRKFVDDRWAEYIKGSDFLDCFVIKKRQSVATGGSIG